MTAQLSRLDQIEQGRRLHASGAIEEAGRIYRRLLEVQPDDPEVMHLAGVALHQSLVFGT